MRLSDYLKLFPGSTREKQKFMALAEAVLRQAADLAVLTAELQAGFSLASAEGIQLDAFAEVLGLSREAGMADETFRQYLRAKLALWRWDGTNEGIPAALAAQPGVTVTDNGNGTVTVSPAGTEREMVPVSAGVRVNS